LARLIKKLNVWAGREIFYFYFLRGVLGGIGALGHKTTADEIEQPQVRRAPSAEFPHTVRPLFGFLADFDFNEGTAVAGCQYGNSYQLHCSS